MRGKRQAATAGGADTRAGSKSTRQPDFFLTMKDNTLTPTGGIANSPAMEPAPRTQGRLACFSSTIRFVSVFGVLVTQGLLGLLAIDIDASAQPSSIELEELFRLGDDEEGVLFGGIAQIASDAAGRIYVVDFKNPVMQVFSDAGELVSAFGGKGMGPGEFMRIRNVFVGQDGKVYVWDGQLARLSVFEERPSGTFEFSGTVQIEEHDGKYPSEFVGAGTEGMVFVYGLGFGFCDECEASTEGPRFNDAMLVNEDGHATGDPLVTVRGYETLAVKRGGLVVSWMPLPFAKGSHITMSPSGNLYAGWSDAINIVARPLSGDWQKTITREYEPLPVTKSEMDAVLENLDREQRSALHTAGIPRTRPVFQHFVVDDENRIWIQASTARGASTTEWLIIGPDGADVDAIDLPAGLRLETIRGGKAIGVLTEKGSGPVIVAYQVQG